MRKLNPKIFRIDDRVKIINPEIFIRCGYPFDKEYGKKNLVTEEEKDLLAKLLGLKRNLDLEKDLFMLKYEDSCVYCDMLDRLAYHRIKEAKFGGPNRQVFTELEEVYRGLEGRIIGKKVVNSGIYNSAGGGYSYDGDFDYEPPYLGNAKSHMILTVYFDYECQLRNSSYEIKIEQIHCQKI